MKHPRILIFATALLAAGLTVSACGNGSASSTSAAGGPHNSADVQFATAMIPHHGQAIVMANQVLAKTTDANVRALATNIKNAQTPEITKMSGWLRDWNEPVPNPSAESMAGMQGNTMMTPAQMDQLATATAATAGRVFLTLMPMHHESAISMAKTELARGQNPAAKALAQSIINTQSSEIDLMRTMLSALPRS